VVDPASREPCFGISADKNRRDTVGLDSGTNNTEEARLLHQIVDKDGDGKLDLAEFLAWANYSTGDALTDYSKVKPWIRLFFAYDQNEDARIELSEVGRPRSKTTWI
jgi:Ca2+-binding EF-hand superfamily protein